MLLLLLGNMKDVSAQTPSLSLDDKMKVWKDARYGLFIHWGLYAITAGTYQGKKTGQNRDGAWLVRDLKVPIKEYKKLAEQFNPTHFNADEWVRTAKDCGMKYLVITAKHHDGFALFPSKASDFNVADATPFKKDIVKEIGEACSKYHLLFGLYYSQSQDWTNGGANYGNDPWWDDSQKNRDYDKYINEIVIPQVKEILQYHPDIIWWDTPTNMTKERGERIKAVLADYPGIITNNRLGGVSGDFNTPEQFIPAMGLSDKFWETCMTMNDTWGYKNIDSNWKSPSLLLKNLIDVASKGGNYILNVGPTADGVFPKENLDRMKVIGNWLKKNGEAIYGTDKSPFVYLPFGRCTQKGNKIYLHVFNTPADGKIKVPMTNKVVKSYLLSDPKIIIPSTKVDKFTYFQLPTLKDSIASVLDVEVEGTVVSTIKKPVPSLKAAITATSEEEKNRAKNAVDGNPSSFWKAQSGHTKDTLTLDFGEEYSVSAISLTENNENIRKFVVEYKNGNDWNTLLEGTKMGKQLLPFKSVKTRYVRLIILDCTKEPAIKEMQLFADY